MLAYIPYMDPMGFDAWTMLDPIFGSSAGPGSRVRSWKSPTSWTSRLVAIAGRWQGEFCFLVVLWQMVNHMVVNGGQMVNWSVEIVFTTLDGFWMDTKLKCWNCVLDLCLFFSMAFWMDFWMDFCGILAIFDWIDWVGIGASRRRTGIWVPRCRSSWPSRDGPRKSTTWKWPWRSWKKPGVTRLKETLFVQWVQWKSVEIWTGAKNRWKF